LAKTTAIDKWVVMAKDRWMGFSNKVEDRWVIFFNRVEECQQVPRVLLHELRSVSNTQNTRSQEWDQECTTDLAGSTEEDVQWIALRGETWT
jgi:hypothetical protein